MRVGLFKSTSSAGRPKTAQSNIRGKVISGPIPIPDPVDDDEFPIRQSGAGLATPSGNEGIGNLLVFPEASSTLGRQSTAGAVPETMIEGRTNSLLRAEPRQVSVASGSPPRGRTNSTLRYSTVSTGTDTDQSGSTHRRKKSGLRNTLGRLFGRKKSPSALETHHEAPSSSLQHRSVSRVYTPIRANSISYLDQLTTLSVGSNSSSSSTDQGDRTEAIRLSANH